MKYWQNYQYLKLIQIFGKHQYISQTNEIFGKGWDILETNKISNKHQDIGLIRYLAQGGIGSVLIERPANLPGLKHFQANFKVG